MQRRRLQRGKHVNGLSIDPTVQRTVPRAKTALWACTLTSSLLPVVWAEISFASVWAVTGERLGIVIAALLLGLGLFKVAVKRWRGSGRTFLLAGVAIFVISRGAWLMVVSTNPISDFYYYFTSACSLSKGGSIPLDDVLGEYQNWWAYPLFLAPFLRAFGCVLTVPKVLNLVLGGLVVPLMYSIARRTTGEAAGRWAVTLYILWLAQLMFTSVPATEHLALPLAMAGLLFGLRAYEGGPRWLYEAGVSGILLGAATAVRPAAIAFAAAVAIAAVTLARPWRSRLVLVGIIAAGHMMMDVAYKHVFASFRGGHAPTLGFSTAANLLYGSNYQHAGMWNETDAATINKWPRAEALRRGTTIVRERWAALTPGAAVKFVTMKNQEFWAAQYFAHLYSTRETQAPPRFDWIRSGGGELAPYVYQMCLAVLAGIAFPLLIKQSPQPATVALALVIAIATLLHLILVVASRYSYIFIPPLILLVSAGLGSRSTSAVSRTQELY